VVVGRGGACLKTPSSNSGIISQDVSEDGCALGWPWFCCTTCRHLGSFIRPVVKQICHSNHIINNISI